MTRLIRGAGLVIIAVALAGCGSNAAGSAGAAGSSGPASSSAAPQISLPGHSFLHVVFRGASGFCPQPAHRAWTGPNVLTPRYPQLLAVAAAGDFEGYLSFGLGLSARGPYHVSTLTGADRIVIDVSHVTSK